jgi:hypothetical protein
LFILIKYFEGYIFIGYIFIDKNNYFKNKRLIDNFIDQEDKYIAGFYLEIHSNKSSCAEIYVKYNDKYDCFIEYMFRKLGKDIIACLGLYCINFKKLKEMNVMIPEIHEKMWVEKDRWGHDGVVYTKASDYKLIQILQNYSNLYTFGGIEYKNICKEIIEKKISEYRGVNNDKLYHEEPQQNNMYIFIQQKIYDQNIFQIEDILDEKRIERDAEFIIDVDKRRPDDQRL